MVALEGWLPSLRQRVHRDAPNPGKGGFGASHVPPACGRTTGVDIENGTTRIRATVGPTPRHEAAGTGKPGSKEER